MREREKGRETYLWNHSCHLKVKGRQDFALALFNILPRPIPLSSGTMLWWKKLTNLLCSGLVKLLIELAGKVEARENEEIQVLLLSDACLAKVAIKQCESKGNTVWAKVQSASHLWIGCVVG